MISENLVNSDLRTVRTRFKSIGLLVTHDSLYIYSLLTWRFLSSRMFGALLDKTANYA